MATPGFRDAAALLRGARAAVLPEGGLHHAAAAVGCRAVVLFGAFGDPRATGYAEHINIRIDRETDRGWRGPHAGAEAAMRLITPDHVAGALDLLILGAP